MMNFSRILAFSLIAAVTWTTSASASGGNRCPSVESVKGGQSTEGFSNDHEERSSEVTGFVQADIANHGIVKCRYSTKNDGNGVHVVWLNTFSDFDSLSSDFWTKLQWGYVCETSASSCMW